MSDLISRLSELRCQYNCFDEHERDAYHTLSEAIKAISAQPEYRLDEWCTECKEYDHERHCCPRFNHVIRNTLQEVKEEQVERKKGKWVFDYNNPYRRCKARCSICGKYSGIGGIRSNQLKPFCPNCGAEMTGGEQE